MRKPRIVTGGITVAQTLIMGPRGAGGPLGSCRANQNRTIVSIEQADSSVRAATFGTNRKLMESAKQVHPVMSSKRGNVAKVQSWAAAGIMDSFLHRYEFNLSVR